MSRRVCIIGAGMAGLTTLKELVSPPDTQFEVTVYEKSAEVGGMWQYADCADQIGGPGFLFKSLRANGPKQVWEYPGCPLPENTSAWMTSKEIKDYFLSIVDKFDLRPHIQFNTEVLKIARQTSEGGQDQWTVTTKKDCEGSTKNRIFDFVIVCHGVLMEPYQPEIEDDKLFRGSIIHSTKYRLPGVYKDKKVLLVGGSVFMSDVCWDISESAAKIYVSFDKPTPFSGLPKNAEFYPSRVKRLKEHSVVFNDGHELEIDDIIFCTGFENLHLGLYHESCELEMKHDYYFPLYKSVIHVKHPSLMFVALFDYKPCTLLCRVVAAFVASYMRGQFTLPDRTEMLQDIEREFSQCLRSDLPKFPKLSFRFDEYVESLCKMANLHFPPLPFIISNHVFNQMLVYNRYHVLRNESYKQLSDTSFEVVLS